MKRQKNWPTKTIVCRDCSIVVEGASFRSTRCRDCQQKEKDRGRERWAQNNRARGLCRCGKIPRKDKKTCARCRRQANKNRKRHGKRKEAIRKAQRIALRLKVIAIYGGKCSCCTEFYPDALQFDHIGGWGKHHRGKNGKRLGGYEFLRWIIRNNYPMTIRLLCGSCHVTATRLGKCPCESMSAAELVATAVNWKSELSPQ